MSADRWSRVKEVFWDILQIPSEHRTAALERRCAGDSALRADVETLLRDHDDSDGFLESSPNGQAVAGAIRAGEADDAELAPGTGIGQYTVVGTLGRGGMGVAWFARAQADTEAAHRALDKADEIERRVDDPALRCRLANSRGCLARNEGRHADARRLIERSLDLARAVGDEWAVASRQANLSMLLWEEGRLEEARRHKEASILAFRRFGDVHGVAIALPTIASLSGQLGDRQRATEALLECIDILRDIGAGDIAAFTLEAAAEIADPVDSDTAALLGASDAIRDRIDLPRRPIDRERHQARLDRLHAALDPSTLDRAREAGLSLDLGAALDLAERLIRAAADG